MNINYTFIIPHKNTPHLLERCIKSIPERSDIEIIIIDDNSEATLKPHINRSDAICISLNSNESNGAGHARNIGMKYAHGKWLIFADSDDYYVKDFILVFDKYCKDNVDVLYFNYNYIDENGKILPTDSLQQILDKKELTVEDFDFIKFRNNTPWSKIVQRTYIERHDITFEEVVNGNDCLFSILVGYFTNNISVIPMRLYNYIRTTESITTKKKTIKELQCRVDHMVKHNAFNLWIGHPEWNHSVVLYLFSIIKNYGIAGCLVIYHAIHNLLLVKHFRIEWVSIIKNKE